MEINYCYEMDDFPQMPIYLLFSFFPKRKREKKGGRRKKVSHLGDAKKDNWSKYG